MDDPTMQKKAESITTDELLWKKQHYGSETATLIVGEHERVFKVHEFILQENSPIFKAALEKRWRESKTRVVELPDDIDDIVLAYINYLYRKNVIVIDVGCQYAWLARLYCFGEKVMDDVFCNKIASALIDKSCERGEYASPFPISSDAVAITYAGTPKGSPLRHFFITLYARYGQNTWLIYSGFCPEFLQDLAMEMLRDRSSSTPPRAELWMEEERWMK